MPKGGSGFKRSAFAAARSALGNGNGGRGSGTGWIIRDYEAAEAVQNLFERGYRRELRFQPDREGHITDFPTARHDKFFYEASDIADKIAQRVEEVDEYALKQYKTLLAETKKIRISHQEMKDFSGGLGSGKTNYLRENKNKNYSDPGVKLEELRRAGLITDSSAVYNNVDAMAIINDAVNAAGSRAYTNVAKAYGADSAQELAYDIFGGIMRAYVRTTQKADRNRRK